MHEYRTHNCGQLTQADSGKEVKLSGWVHRKRDHGGVFFIDLRDHYGITQIVTSDKDGRDVKLYALEYERINALGYEAVICVSGKVVLRDADQINQNMATGEIEILMEKFEILSTADTLPMTVNSDSPFPEDIRLRYRFLDLRREGMHRNILLRDNVIWYIRQKMKSLNFNEIQTPILTASSPEGARDFLVPSRLHPGKFFALPQAPQQFKQLLMTSGFDKYFQIAPCFRDEDARADRAPGEFYQLDMEMSFVTQEDIFATIEPVIHGLFSEFTTSGVMPAPWNKIKYHDAMYKYGTDKPDLRNPIEISDVSHVFADSDFSIFRESVKKGMVVRAIPAPKTSDKSRGFFDKMIACAQKEFGAKGLGYITFNPHTGEAKGPIAKFLSDEKIEQIKSITKIQNSDSVFFSCDKELSAATIAGKVRIKLGQLLDIIEENVFKFCWVVDYPLYEYNADEGKVEFSHNPFSMPQGGMKALEGAKTKEEQLKILAYQYDLICNGIELSSGAIRNHRPEVMYKAFEIAGHDKEFVDKNFSCMINAFKYGAPPHGGIAPGIDRMVMLIAGVENIREVIAFPLNQTGKDPLTDSPKPATLAQLRELGIRALETKS